MYLFKNSNDKTEIYNLSFNYENIIQYRRDCLSRIPDNDKFYISVTNCNQLFSSDNDKLNMDDINKKDKKIFHEFFPREFKPADNSLVEYYCTGFKNHNTYEVFGKDEIKYFIPLSNKYRIIDFDEGTYIMDDILRINKELYILERFLNNGIVATLSLEDSDLIKLLGNFEINSVDEFNGYFLQTKEKNEASERILKLYRKQG